MKPRTILVLAAILIASPSPAANLVRGTSTAPHRGVWEISLPLDDPQNDALVFDYEAEGRLVYVKDLAFDAGGRPIVLHLTSGGAEPGPANGPRPASSTPAIKPET